MPHHAVFWVLTTFSTGRRPPILLAFYLLFLLVLVPQKWRTFSGIYSASLPLTVKAVCSFKGEFRLALCATISSVPFILLLAEMPPNLKSPEEYIFIFLINFESAMFFSIIYLKNASVPSLFLKFLFVHFIS